jgi:hypothetical protein
MRSARHLRAVWLALLAAASPAAAGEVSFSASVDRNVVGLEDRFTLTLTVRAPDLARVEKLALPDVGTLEILSQREQTATTFSFSGGSQDFRRIKNVLIVLKPTREGATTIGRATLRYGGQSYTTEPITIQVVKNAPRAKSGRRAPAPGMSPFPFDDDFFRSPFDDPFFRSPLDEFLGQQRPIDEKDAFVEAYVSPDVVIQGQQVTVTVMVYSRIDARIGETRWPKLDGFYAVDRDVSGARTEQKFIDGERYLYKLHQQKALFPLKAGEFALDPVSVEMVLSASPFSQETRTLKTRPLKLKVLPLPEAGRPADFSEANVGRFTLSAAVDATQVALNQPVTLTLTLRGTGNIHQARIPELPALDKFKRFDPAVDVQAQKSGAEVRGAKTVEYVLVPLATGELVLPEVKFSFFDPVDNRYRTIQTEPITLKVTASTDAPPGTETGREVNLLAGTFKPIRFESTLSGYGHPLYRRSFFWPIVAVPPALWLLLVLGGAVSRIARSDSPRGKARQALSRARAHLKQASRHAACGMASEFFSEIKAALLDGIEARLGVPAQGMLLEEIRRSLLSAGADPADADGLVHELENCDFGRFAPASSRGQEMQDSLQRSRRLLQRLTRNAGRSPS